MKIAIIHDDFSVFGGGEKMMFELAIELKADIITFSLNEEVSKILKQYEQKPRILKLKNKNDPINEELKRYYFSNLKLKEKYDFYIFSGHQSINAAKNHKPNLYYINYIPDFIAPRKIENKHHKKEDFPLKNILIEISLIKKKIVKRELPEKIKKIINKIVMKISTMKNPAIYKEIKNEGNAEAFLKNLESINRLIVNSNNIQQKVKKFYKKEGKIIYPFIDKKLYNSKKTENFWVSINRINPYKRIEIQVKTFSKLPKENLIIIGQKEVKSYYDALLKIKTENVKFLGLISEKEKIDLLSKCKGVIFTGYDEDFGLVPVEAMACGKPVIGPEEGGLSETIINGKTGILIENINDKKIIDAVKKVNESYEKFTKKSPSRAKDFDKIYFLNKIIKEINCINKRYGQ